MVPDKVREYLIYDMEAAPLLMERVLAGTPDWDARTDPNRFTLREMTAHLADWEAIWLERIQRLATEDSPFLPSVDEGEMAASRAYSTSNPTDFLRRYREGRLSLVAAINQLSPETWDRPAHREFVGDIDFLQLIAMIVGHDGYHLKQAVEFT